ncbi:MAG: M23 family metallopeptidase [Oscillospiraceae bacterium]
MKNYKLFLSAALFLLLTGCKLLLPNATAVLRERVREVICRDFDYEQAFETLGARLSDGAIIQTLGGGAERLPERTAPQRTPYTPKTLNDIIDERSRVLPENVVHAASATTTETDAEPKLPEAVAAFMERQAEYADKELPANVSCDFPELPFGFQSPVTGCTSSGFGFRLHPIKNEVKFHFGTDFAAWSGVDILSFADGTVSMVGWDDGYGNYITIDHADGWRTLYAHCGKVYVLSGQKVAMGEKIALVGATGEVTGPHLHFELTCAGKYYNPEFWLA